MLILGIDTSCDDSCAAIFDTDSWRLAANVVHSHVDVMKKFGGVVPEVASREHLKGLPLAVVESLEQAGLKADAVDWVVATNRPGLIGALLVGVSFGKALAYSFGKPFSVINHVEAHLYSPLLATAEREPAPPFPWIGLVVSGGHTELFHVKDIGDYQWLGGTLDDAAGEAFDKIGKLLGLPYPAGPFIDRWVREKATSSDRKRYSFPRAQTPAHCFSYSGLKTSVSLQWAQIKDASEADKLSVVASAQEAILDPIVEKVQQAQFQLGLANAVITGGVACNSRLREKLTSAFFPPPRFCADNAAMVAMLAAALYSRQRLKPAPWTVTAHPSLDGE